MSDISTLKEKIDTGTLSLFLLAIVTFGLYTYVWLYKVSTAVEEVTQIKVMSKTFLVGLLALVTWGAFLAFFVGILVQGFMVLWNVTVWLVALVWCLRVRRALRAYALAEHHFEPKINRVFSALFTFYHLNYCINALPRDKQKHEDKKRLKQQSVQA